MIALDFRWRGTNHGQHADDSKSDDEAGHVGDCVARVTTASGNKRLKSLDSQAVAQHRKDDDWRKLPIQRVGQTEYGRRQHDKHGRVNEQITDALNPRELSIAYQAEGVWRQ